MHKRAFSFPVIFTFTFCLYLLVLFLIKHDTAFVYRWPLFIFYLLDLLILPLYLLIQKKSAIIGYLHKSKNYLKSTEGKKDIWIFLLIVLLTLITRFLFLKEHPFLTWGDELWEAGLDTLSIFSGNVKNFYIIGFPSSYRMPSMGFIQSLLSLPFVPFFAHTPYMYRISTALIGVMNILFVYLICRKHINRSVAFFAAITLIALPIHIYFSRTEIVHISNLFMTTSIIYLLFLTQHYFWKNTKWLAITGLWLGFTVTFQTSGRIIALVSFGVILCMHLLYWLTQKNRILGLKLLVVNFIVLCISGFIGFGPKILFITPKTFLHSQQSVLFQNINKEELAQFTPKATVQLSKNGTNILTQRYPTSFLGYIKEPLTNLVEFHYTEEKPLLPPLLAIVFLIGLVSLLWTQFPLGRWFGFFALIIPLTHSALTPDLNWSYRLFIAAAALAVIIGIGMWQIISKIPNKLIRYIIIATFCLYLYRVTLVFFILEPHMANRPVEEYMTTHLAYFLQSHLDQNKQYNYCMRVAPEQLKFLNWIHAHNQYEYFAPQAQITVSADPSVPVDTVYLDENCQPKSTYTRYVIQCSQNLYSVCPQPTLFRQQFEPNEINKDFVFYY